MALTALLATSMHVISEHGLFASKGGYHEDTLAANVTLDDTYPSILGFDPGGAARDVVLDGDSAAIGDSAIHGLFRIIVNRADAAENLVIKDATGVTIATANQSDAAILYHDEDSGWTLLAMVVIALT